MEKEYNLREHNSSQQVKGFSRIEDKNIIIKTTPGFGKTLSDSDL